MAEALDARKAAVWSVIAGAAHVAVVAVGHVGYPYVYDALIAVGYGLMLPAIAVLHPRHGRMRESGTILATIAGTATVTVGLAGSVNVDLQPAALFILGMWWWTIGKLWAETEILPRPLGRTTAGLGALTIISGLLAAVSVGLTVILPSFPDVAVWTIAQGALGVWLMILGATLSRAAADVPSR